MTGESEEGFPAFAKSHLGGHCLVHGGLGDMLVGTIQPAQFSQAKEGWGVGVSPKLALGFENSQHSPCQFGDRSPFEFRLAQNDYPGTSSLK